MSSDEKPIIFLCHAHEDKDEIDEIYLTLKDAGLNPWMDKPPKPYDFEGIKPGEEWDIVIRNMIRKSAYFLAFLSKRSVGKRGYVQREYRLALQMMGEVPTGQIFLIPILLEECDLPEISIDGIQFRQLQWLSLYEDGHTKLIRFLKEDLESRINFLGRSATTFLYPSTANEFSDAIGSNRVLELQGKDYLLSKVANKYREYVDLEERHDGKSLVIKGVNEIRLIGHKESKTRLVVNPRYVDVLRFIDCENISIKNLTMGHEPSGYCTGAVITFENCSRVKIEDCDLFGCGTQGIQLNNVNHFIFSRSIIRDCTYGILSLRNSSDIRFQNSRFIDNEMFYGFSVSHSRDISISNCSISSNISTHQELFKCSASSRISIKESKIFNNYSTDLTSSDSPLILESVDVIENSWQEQTSSTNNPTHVFYLMYKVDDGTINLHAIKREDKSAVLAFESLEVAKNYARKLESQSFPKLKLRRVQYSKLKDACNQNDCLCRLVREGESLSHSQKIDTSN